MKKILSFSLIIVVNLVFNLVLAQKSGVSEYEMWIMLRNAGNNPDEFYLDYNKYFVKVSPLSFIDEKYYKNIYPDWGVL